MQDDTRGTANQLRPFAQLELGLSILRTAETIAVGMAFVKAMGCNPENTTLFYKFKWDRLKERELGCWDNPEWCLFGGRKAYQDNVQTSVEIPLDTPSSRLGEYVKKLIDPLFEIFDGFEISQEVVDDLTNRLLNRRL